MYGVKRDVLTVSVVLVKIPKIGISVNSFSNACDDIANSYEKGKNALLGIKERAENAGKIRAALQLEAGGQGDTTDTGSAPTESFSTIVHPTQPEGHENFHSLF